MYGDTNENSQQIEFSASMQNPYIIGRPVTGEEFFGRRKETERFFRYLEPIQPFEVVGLDRSGKTSFLKHIANSAESREVARSLLGNRIDKIAITYLDLQSAIKSPSQFLVDWLKK